MVLFPVVNDSLPPGQKLRADANYTRATTLRLVEKLPPALLFGEHGEAFRPVLDRAFSLEPEAAEILANKRRSINDVYFSAAWDNWLRQQNAKDRLGWDHSSVLELPLAYGGPYSPVNHGFTLLSGGVRHSARMTCGDGAFVEEFDEAGESVGLVLVEPWTTALDALLDAGMALGAPKYLTKNERKALLVPWRCIQ